MRYSIDPKVCENIDNNTGLIGVFDIVDNSIVIYAATLSFGESIEQGYLSYPIPAPKSDGYVLYNSRCMVFEIRGNKQLIEDKSLVKDVLEHFGLTDKRVDLVIEDVA